MIAQDGTKYVAVLEKDNQGRMEIVYLPESAILTQPS